MPPAGLQLLVLVVLATPVQPQAAAEVCAVPSYECAAAQVSRHEFRQAITTLHRLLETGPGELRTLNLLGIALTGAGRVTEANRRFEEVLAADPRFYPSRKNLAVNYATLGRLDEARRELERVLTEAPDDQMAHLHFAEILVRQGDTEAALAHYSQSGDRVFEVPDWTLHYAASLVAAGRLAEAAAALERVPEKAGAALFEGGVLLSRAGAYRDAATLFGRARRSYDDPYAAGYNQLLMLTEAGAHKEAIAAGEAALTSGPRTAEMLGLLSRAYLGSGRIKQAYDALREATALEPTAEAYYLDLAAICLDHENFDLGLEIVDIGLRSRPGSAALHIHRGVLLTMKGLVTEAEESFERAAALAPEGTAAVVALAMAWMQNGRTPDAVELLRTRASRPGADAAIHYALGVALLRSGVDPSSPAALEAVRSFTSALDLEPALLGARVELGKLLLKRDQIVEAIQHLEQAVALDPSSATAAYSLAQGYRRAGRVDKAQDLMARVTSLNAQQRGDEADGDLRRLVVRIVRAGEAPPAASTP